MWVVGITINQSIDNTNSQIWVHDYISQLDQQMKIYIVWYMYCVHLNKYGIINTYEVHFWTNYTIDK